MNVHEIPTFIECEEPSIEKPKKVAITPRRQSMRINSNDLALGKPMSPLSKRDLLTVDQRKIYYEIMQAPRTGTRSKSINKVTENQRKILKVYTDEQRIQFITQSAGINFETCRNKLTGKQTIEEVVNEIKNAKVNYIKEKAQISANIAKMEEMMAMKAEIKVNDSIRRSSRMINKIRFSTFKQSNGASNSKDKNYSNSKEFPQTLFLKFKNQIKDNKEVEPVKKKIKKNKSNKIFQKKQKFTLFNMNDKEKLQFQRDLYSPVFEQTETYRHMMTAGSLKTLFNTHNDLYQVMRGKSNAKPQVGFATKCFDTCVPKTPEERSKSATKSIRK